MAQIMCILKRLKKPSVVISIISQIATILIMFNINIDKRHIIDTLYAVCSILVTLGIISSPDSKKMGYSDDILYCAKCGEYIQHIEICENMVCKDCGHIYIGKKNI